MKVKNNILKVDKLYFCEDQYLFLYPDQNSAEASDAILPVDGRFCAAVATAIAGREAAYYSKKFGKSISFIDKAVVLLILNNVEDKYYEVLAGDKKGWILYRDWLNIKEVEYGGPNVCINSKKTIC